MTKACGFKNLAMLLLAWYPILDIYKSPLLLGYGRLLVLLLCIVSFFTSGGDLLKLNLPRQYYVYWMWCAFAYFISFLPQIEITALIPGGLDLVLFSIILNFYLSVFDVDAFKKHLKVVVIIAGVILVIQELMYFTSGSRFIALLPSGELVDRLPMHDLIDAQMRAKRSCSLFREPAHFAQFLLPVLCLEIFSEKNKEKLFTPYELFIILILVLLRSGNGFVGLIVLYGVKGVSYFKNVKMGEKIFMLFVSLPLLTYAVNTYISTEAGMDMLERSEELENDDSAASYIRVYRGYALYSELPFENKILGINNDNLMKIIPHTTISYLFNGEAVHDLYMNGIQMVLVHNGLIGLLICIWMFISIGKRRTIQGKMQLMLLLTLALLGQIYLSYTMLYTMLFCLTDKTVIPKNYRKPLVSG